MQLLDIREVATRTGVKPSALRYYEEVGLISPVSRHGLRRQFAPDVLLQLRLIAMGKAAGFSLTEIAGMFGRHGQLDIPRERLHQKADVIDRQLQDLKVLRDTLRHVADCRAPTHLECPRFQQLMGAAGRAAPARKGGRVPR